MITSNQATIIKNVLDRINPTLIGVFGSFARGEENENSDLDLLIDFEQKEDLLELIGIEQELTELLGIKVASLQKDQFTPNSSRLLKKI